MATESSSYRRMEEESREITSGRKSPTPQEGAPPRPSDMPGTPSKAAAGRSAAASGDRADVHIRTDSRDQVHVDVETGEGATGKVRSTAGTGGGWPKDGEEWKRMLSRAAPWLAAAAIVAASAYGYQKDKSGRTNGETRLGSKMRRAGGKVSDAAEQLGEAESSKRGWFGLGRSRTEEAADRAAGELAGAKRAAGKKAEEAKGAAKGAADKASDKAAKAAAATKGAARDAAAATKGAARDASATAKGAAGRAADAAHGAAEGVRGAAADAAGRAAGAARSAKGAVKAGAERAEDVAEEAADKGFFLWKTATKGVKDRYRATKQEAKHLAGEAADTAAGAAHATAATARGAARGAADAAKGAAHGAAEAARDAKDWTKEKAGEAADVARRAEHAVSDTLYAGTAKVVGEAGAAEEQTGKAMRKAGERIETAGRETKNYYRGEAAEPEVQPKKKRWLGIW